MIWRRTVSKSVWLQGDVYTVRLVHEETGIEVSGSGRDFEQVERMLREQLAGLVRQAPQPPR